MHKGFLKTAMFLGMLSVALGAFGAHKLKEILSEQYLGTFETAVRYQFFHVFALALTGILYQNWPNKNIQLAGRFFICGLILFCGSLYLLVLGAAIGTSFSWAGPVTPLGGLLLILGWGYLGLGIGKNIK